MTHAYMIKKKIETKENTKKTRQPWPTTWPADSVLGQERETAHDRGPCMIQTNKREKKQKKKDKKDKKKRKNKRKRQKNTAATDATQRRLTTEAPV